MNSKIKQDVKLVQKQKLKLTPQLTQSLGLLQASTLELENQINEMLEKNIMLEVKSANEDLTLESNISDDSNIDEFVLEQDTTWDDIDDSYQDINQLYQSTSEFEPDWVKDNISFDEKIETAIFSASFSEVEKQMIPIILDTLNEHYFLEITPKEISKKYHLNLETLLKTIEKIKHLDPPGVASQTIQECFLAQLETTGNNNDPYLNAYLIIRDFFIYLGKNNQLIQSRLGLSNLEFNEAVHIIRTLSPYPDYDRVATSDFIKPDIYIYQKMGFFLASKTPDLGELISINQSYANLEKKYKGDEKKYITAQLQEARWFINAIQQRSSTLIKVANAIVLHQQTFFLEGESAIKPLKISDIAKNTDLNESTISRVINNKYLKYKHKTYELKYFFSREVKSDHPNSNHSSASIKSTIKTLIETENPKKPISDSDITEHMIKQGIKIARRTIAKYRESLGIANASKRKRKL